MKKPVLKLLFVTGVFCLAGTAFSAQAEEESDLKAPVKTDYRAVDKLNLKLDDASVNNDLQEADAVANRGIENEAKAEAVALTKNMARLEKRIKALKAGAEESRRNAELAQKQTELIRLKNTELKKRFIAASQAKAKADRELEAKRKKLAAAEAESAYLAAENHKLEVLNQAAFNGHAGTESAGRKPSSSSR